MAKRSAEETIVTSDRYLVGKQPQNLGREQ